MTKVLISKQNLISTKNKEIQPTVENKNFIFGVLLLYTIHKEVTSGDEIRKDDC